MEQGLKERFAALWREYFSGSELPIVFFYAGGPGAAQRARSIGRSCIICDLAAVRRGTSLAFDVEAVGCGGARRYLGFVPDLRPSFEYFLSCGIPGQMEGERYKKSPALVRAMLERMPQFDAPAPMIVFKRWDHLDEADEPAAAIFFAPPDVLSGLFTLAGYDEADLQAVVAPFGSGCASIVYHPYQELLSGQVRAVLGMFDVSARPCVEPDLLTLAVPWPRLVRMVAHMDESFLTTGSWRQVRERLPGRA